MKEKLGAIASHAGPQLGTESKTRACDLTQGIEPVTFGCPGQHSANLVVLVGQARRAIAEI